MVVPDYQVHEDAAGPRRNHRCFVAARSYDETFLLDTESIRSASSTNDLKTNEFGREDRESAKSI